VDMAARSFLKLTKKNPDDIDIHAFKWDIDELISRQHFSRPGEHHSDDFVKLALKYDLSVPRSFSLLERALVLVESTCLDLDQDFNLMDEVKALTREMARSKYSPHKIMEDFQMEWDSFYELIKNVPSGINDIFETVKMFKAANVIKQENAKQKKIFINSILQNLYLTILLIASIALLIWKGDNPALEIIGIGGFVVSLILGIIMILKK